MALLIAYSKKYLLEQMLYHYKDGNAGLPPPHPHVSGLVC